MMVYVMDSKTLWNGYVTAVCILKGYVKALEKKKALPLKVRSLWYNEELATIERDLQHYEELADAYYSDLCDAMKEEGYTGKPAKIR